MLTDGFLLTTGMISALAFFNLMRLLDDLAMILGLLAKPDLVLTHSPIGTLSKEMSLMLSPLA
jgi:hypothetical protein